MGKYYGYARVSTKDQSDHSLDNQIKYLKVKAKELNLEFEEYREKESGKTVTMRPELQKIIQKAGAGDYVGVYDNSRFGRDTQETLQAVDKLIGNGVTVQIGGQDFDVHIPRQRLIFTIESAISEFYRREQNLKSRVGIDQKKESGEWIFTNRLFGYELMYKGQEPIVSIVKEEANLIRHIYTEYSKGKTIRKVTEEINALGHRTRTGVKFNEATVRRILLRPIYKGFYKEKAAGGRQGQDKTPLNEATLVKSKYYKPIVSEQLWEKVQNSYRSLRRDHTIQFEYRYSYYELTSVLKCYHCKQIEKATSYVHSFHKPKKYRRANSNYVNRIHKKGCTQKFHTFRAWVLERLFRACFYLVFADSKEIGQFMEQQRKTVDEESDNVQKDISRIDNRIEEQEKKKANYLVAIGNGLDYEEVRPILDEIKKEVDELNRKRAELENIYWEFEEQFIRLAEEYSEAQLISFINAERPALRREVYHELIHSAYVFNSQIIIRYTNSKLFIIPLKKNKGKNIQRVFEIKVYFMNKYQYSIKYSSIDKNIELIDVYNKIEKKKESKFSKALFERRKKQIEDLMEKVNVYRTMDVSSVEENETVIDK